MFLILFSFISSVVLAAAPTELRISAYGVTEIKGNLVYNFFATEQDYLNESNEFLRGQVPVQGETTIIDLQNFPPGDYAVVIFHDENENGEMDKNFIGIPQEKFGISGITEKLWSKPGWDKIKFEVKADQRTEISVLLKFL